MYICTCMCIYVYLYIYIYIYSMLTPPSKPTGFDCFDLFYSMCCLFLPQIQPAVLHSFEDFGCLSVMSHDASCVDTMTYFYGDCSVFDYLYTALCSQQGHNAHGAVAKRQG